jgi:hypothetical protein
MIAVQYRVAKCAFRRIRRKSARHAAAASENSDYEVGSMDADQASENTGLLTATVGPETAGYQRK